jgi:uncharacterized protein YcnI
MKKIAAILPMFALLVAGVASAHVTVKPAQVGIGAFQTFTVSVPSEKSIATTSVRLVLPEGLEHVSPTVKPGWNIALVHGEAVTESTESEHESEPVVKEIVWTGGSIPGEYRDEFSFSAKVPATETSLSWKAYQTYKDGSLVSWDLAAGEQMKENPDGSEFGPASITKVVNDLQPAQQQGQMKNTDMGKQRKYDDSLFVSMIAVILSVFAIYLASRKPSAPIK